MNPSPPGSAKGETMTVPANPLYGAWLLDLERMLEAEEAWAAAKLAGTPTKRRCDAKGTRPERHTFH